MTRCGPGLEHAFHDTRALSKGINMSRRNGFVALGLAAAALFGYWQGAGGSPAALVPGPSTALADGTLLVEDGETFVSADGGNAYLWRRDGDRIVLLNHCERIDEGVGGQATYVSVPGIERGS